MKRQKQIERVIVKKKTKEEIEKEDAEFFEELRNDSECSLRLRMEPHPMSIIGELRPGDSEYDK